MSVRTTVIRLLAITASAWAISGAAQAEIVPGGQGERLERLRQMSPEDRQRALADYRNLPPEQQAEKRRDLRESFAALTPEQRQQMRQQMREHWQQMPPEERRQMREQRQAQREDRQQLREQRSFQREERPQRGWRGR